MHSRSLNRSPRLVIAGFVTAIWLALTATIGALPSRGATTDLVPILDGQAVAFVSFEDTAYVRAFDVEGNYLDSDEYSQNFGEEDSDIEALAADYVTVTGQNNADGNVIVADADTGFVFVGIGTIDAASIGFPFYGGFDEGDQLFIGNMSTINDHPGSGLSAPAAQDEVLIAHADNGLVDVFSYDPGASGSRFKKLDPIDVDFSESDRIAATEVDTDSDYPGSSNTFEEILVADAGTGSVRGYNWFGGSLGQSLDVGYDAGDGFATGNFDGFGDDEYLIANPDTGSIDVRRFGAGNADTLVTSFDAGFSANDAVAMADVNGNGMDDILVADAVTSQIAVYTYDVTEDPNDFGDEVLATGSFDSQYSTIGMFAVLPVRYPDLDNDGLYDHWEMFGLDVDANGAVDLPLHTYGADPEHKDIFVELDRITGVSMNRSNTQAVIEAFDAAPAGAGGTFNLDGEPGINIWIDTGDLRESGQPVGHDLGGGNPISPPSTLLCGLDDTFYALKNEHFNPLRRLVFRYGISASNSQCPQKDRKGGEGEIGGNDFIEFNRTASTLMHEIGHTLNLHHGGGQIINCKPNYISVMNYDHQGGIRRADGSRLVDFSPARVFGDTRGTAPLAQISEANLDETQVLDSSDTQNQVAFTNAKGEKVRAQANQRLDWNGDGDTDDTGIAVNINTVGGNGLPTNCKNDSATDILIGHDDWSAIRLSFRHDADSASGAIDLADDEGLPTIEEIREIEEELHTTDLEIQQVADANPVGAGSELTYTLTITNNGPNPVTEAEVVITLPDEVTYRDSSDTCVEDNGEVRCTLEQLQATDERQVTITVDVPLSLGLDDDVPAVLTSTATVSDLSEFAQDSEPDNNTSTVETEVEIQSDLEMISFQPTSTPVELVVGQPAEIEFETVVTNHGPEPTPVTATFEVTEPKSGPIIAGLSSLNRTEDLALDEVRTLTGTVLLTCSEAGTHEVEIVNTTGLREERIVDPNPDNNQAAAEISVECLLPVAINIKPGSDTNPINLNSQVPVALLTTDAGQYGLPEAIDVAQIEPASILFGAPDQVLGVASPTGATPKHGNGHLEDALELDERTRDGDTDLVLHFSAADSGLDADDTEACLRAEIRVNRTDTLEVFGCDTVTIKPRGRR